MQTAGSITFAISLFARLLSLQMQTLQLIVQLFKDFMDWVSQRLCYVVGDTDRPVSYVGPRFIVVSSERLKKWSLYTS